MGTRDQTSSTQKNEPWAPQGQQLQFLYDEARKAYGDPSQFYPGSTVSQQFSAQTLEGEQAGLGLIRGAGQGPGQDYLQQVLGGQFLSPDSNPFLRQMGETIANRTTEAYQRTIAPNLSMGQFGRAGSGAEQNRTDRAQQGLAQELYRGQANLYGGAYQQERGFQQGAAALAPQYAASQRADIQTGYQLGQRPDDLQQSLIDDLRQRFEFGQVEPWQRLQQFNQLITGNVGSIPGISQGTSTVNRGFGGSDIMGSILGLGGIGAMIYGGR